MTGQDPKQGLGQEGGRLRKGGGRGRERKKAETKKTPNFWLGRKF